MGILYLGYVYNPGTGTGPQFASWLFASRTLLHFGSNEYALFSRKNPLQAKKFESPESAVRHYMKLAKL